jgi:hypothetical protein
MTWWTKAGEAFGAVAKILACVVLIALAAVLCRIDNEIPALSASAISTMAQVGGAASSVGAAASGVNTILAEAQASKPKIERAAFDLWKHADRTLTNLDVASGDYGTAQKRIADTTEKVFTHADDLLTKQAAPFFQHGDELLTQRLDPFFAQYTALGNSLAALADGTNKTLNDPLGLPLTLTNLGKLSGDAYTVEHRYFFPDKPMPAWSRVLNGFAGGMKVAEFVYYLHGIGEKGNTVVVSQPQAIAPRVVKDKEPK